MRIHRLLAAVAALTLLAAAAALPASAAPCWSPPVVAPVTDPFREPACPWCPGNRGLEYGTAPGTPVSAVAAGVVTFSGSVAGTAYVVVRLADGLLVTYGGLAMRAVAAGDTVVRGMRVGTTAGRLHLGVRRGERYVDPGPLIGEWRGVVRLVPADGSAAAPAPTPRLACGVPALRPDAGTTWSRGFVNAVR